MFLYLTYAILLATGSRYAETLPRVWDDRHTPPWHCMPRALRGQNGIWYWGLDPGPCASREVLGHLSYLPGPPCAILYTSTNGVLCAGYSGHAHKACSLGQKQGDLVSPALAFGEFTRTCLKMKSQKGPGAWFTVQSFGVGAPAPCHPACLHPAVPVPASPC